MQDTDSSVLIGYDGSDEADAAIRRAGALLAPRRAVVAHVWGSSAELLMNTDITGLTGPLLESARELDLELEGHARAVAATGAELAEEAGFESAAVIARGKPKAWPTLIELAREHGVSAVVVGSRGLGGVKSALLGSVSSGLLDHARLPVLVVPPLEREDAQGPALIGYDGSEHADAAVEAAARLLEVRDVIVQTVWRSCSGAAAAGAAGAPVGVLVKGAERLDAELRLGAQRTAERGAALASEHGLVARAEAACAEGSVPSRLRDTAHQQRASVVVVGSHGRSAVGAVVMGSVSRGIVDLAPAPVLVVPPPR